jgi:excisionase family DNA binding protein
MVSHREKEQANESAHRSAMKGRLDTIIDSIQNKPKEVMNLSEAAEFMGVHENTLRKYAQNGTLPCRKLGTRWLFSKRSLIEWIEEKESEK